MTTSTKLWVGLGVLVLLSPLGIILPAKFSSGSAWGEWSTQEMKKLVGYVPAGMSKLSDQWKAPLPDYATKGQQNAPLRKQSSDYMLSGILGVAVIVGVTVVVGKVIARRENPNSS